MANEKLIDGVTKAICAGLAAEPIPEIYEAAKKMAESAKQAVNSNCCERAKIKTHFAKIIVEGTAENPYYSILYFNPTAKEYYNGFGSYYLSTVFQWLSQEFEIVEAPTVDAVEVVRCQNCGHAEPLDHNCELSTSHYMHCKLWRGEETKNVWHKYKKYYKDYSLVERDGYCDSGAKMGGDGNG